MATKNNKIDKSKVNLSQVREPFIYTSVTLLLIYTVLVGFSLYWNITNIHKIQKDNALAEAKSNWNKDQAFRIWASRHGGLYVKPDKRTQPSPYLSHLPHRDIITTDGTMLTLLNPAFMMRQMIEEYESNYGIKGSITAKKVLNPINKADEWESKALTSFENGKVEIFGKEIINGEPYFRYMKPMRLKKSCLKCHNSSGKIGDIHGGVSVSIPMKPYLDLANSASRSIIVTHLFILFLGYLGIIAYGWMAKKRETERLNFENERKLTYEILEDKVIARTEALNENVQRLDQIMDTAAEGIISCDDKGMIESFNHAAEKIFGHSAKEVIGENINLFIQNSHIDQHNTYINEYLKSGSPVIKGKGREIEAQRKDGSIFPASISISDINFDNKRIFTAIIHDITSVKNHEIALIKAKEQAEKANQIKSDFLASMSHDLRTPLNAILGFSQLLELNHDEPLTNKQSECVEQIIEGGNHLLQLINDILDLAKIEAGKISLSFEDIELKYELDECLNLVETLANENKIIINEKYKTRDNVNIKADSTRIKQILLNILSNAIKYNKKNGLIIVDYEKTSNNMIRISIEDNGIGIAEKNQVDLFTPFSRFSHQSSDIEGTGIGLTVAKSLITLMNGQIDFQSIIGKGSTFWIDIPQSIVNLKVQAEKENEDIHDRETLHTLTGLLLYIEDNQTNIRLMQRIIDQVPNLNMIFANNAEDGIKVAIEKLPDIIILDINLPEKDGFEALKELKDSADTNHIPVIALSAVAAKENIEKGLAAGFEYYLTKPMNITEVMSTIKSVLEK